MTTRGPLQDTGSADVLFATTAAATTEAFVNPIAAQLAKRDLRVQLVTGDRPALAAFDHTSTVLPMQRGISPGADLKSLHIWIRHLRTIKPRMIVTGTPKASLLGLTAARIAEIPTRMYVIHGAVWDGATGNRRRILEAAERATIASSTHQLAVSDSLARLIRDRGVSRRMPDVLGSGSFCGVDVSRFSPAASTEQSGPTMCFVGRLNRDKGIDVLLRTLDRIRERAPATLTVVGGLDTTAPPDELTLNALTRHPHVNWVGEVPNVEDYLRSSTIFLFPTAREGLPQVVLEAQSCGVPVVSWRVTGVIDAVHDGSTGVLVSYGDEEALAAAAISLLEDSLLRKQMSENARDWAVHRFRQSSVVTKNAEYLLLKLARDGQQQ